MRTIRFERVLVSASIVFICTLNPQARDYPVRATYICIADHRQTIPNGFLDLAKEQNYTHVIAESFIDQLGTRETWQSAVQNKMKELFLQCDSKGLKLIPLFQTMDCHSQHWDRTSAAIEWQNVPPSVLSEGKNHSKSMKRVPVFGPDSSGFDKQFTRLISAVLRGLADAINSPRGMNYQNLDYIHLGFDEPVHRWNTFSNYDYILMAGLCEADIAWIESNVPGKMSTENKVVRLIGSSIRRKAETVIELAASAGLTTNIMIYGDMFDPYLLGGYSENTNSSGRLYSFSDLRKPSSENMVAVNTTSLINDPDFIAVKQDVVLIPWCYDSEFNGTEYKVSSTFDALNGKVSFMFGYAIADQGGQITSSRFNQLRELVTVAKDPAYTGSFIGFAAQHWVRSATRWNDAKETQNPTFSNMPYLSAWFGTKPEAPKMQTTLLECGSNAKGSPRSALLISETDITRAEYLSVTGKHPFPFSPEGRLNLPATHLTLYDAVLYCNDLSEEQGLEPVYSFKRPVSLRITDDNCMKLDELSEDTSKNGYRLLYPHELECACLSSEIDSNRNRRQTLAEVIVEGHATTVQKPKKKGCSQIKRTVPDALHVWDMDTDQSDARWPMCLDPDMNSEIEGLRKNLENNCQRNNVDAWKRAKLRICRKAEN